MRRLLAVLMLACATASPACGSGSSSSAVPAPITGAKSCPPEHAQNLTFSGGITGHLVCSIADPACHRTHGPRSPGVTMSLLGVSGSKPIILRIAFGDDHLGTFTATPIGDEPTLDEQGVTLTGVGDWGSPANGGTLKVLVEESPSLSQEGRVAGSMDVTLTSGSSRAEVKGDWSCFKSLAGGDGWSNA